MHSKRWRVKTKRWGLHSATANRACPTRCELGCGDRLYIFGVCTPGSSARAPAHKVTLSPAGPRNEHGAPHSAVDARPGRLNFFRFTVILSKGTNVQNTVQ
eukprot:scaffold97572_cov73-Phaeocystis_antarctica.AAC.7